ncbi:MAG: right-handed parallel beta-helix repeat-containing protein [Phycisphaerales bacterium]|nr:MAG: right-handed parallel beta-helix repeat-containing protein [Phycisphaerales bacterium]
MKNQRPTDPATIDNPARLSALQQSTQRRAMLAGLGGMAAGALLARNARAGELDPPAGPIAPTMKRLDEVEPRTPIGPDTTPGIASNATYQITESGSYYLTGDVLGETGKHGILVSSSAAYVVINLNGFTLLGESGSFAGIFSQASRIVVRDGQIRGWGARGINGTNTSVTLEDLLVEGNLLGGASGGVNVASRARRCAFLNNSGWGLNVGIGSVVESVRAEGNTPAASIGAAGDGIIVRADSLVERCIARNNAGDGVRGDNGYTARMTTSAGNAGHGFSAGGAPSDPGTPNFNAAPVTVETCDARDNTKDGFNLGDGSIAIGCRSMDNSQSGFASGDSTVLQECVASGNGQIGIIVRKASTISGCTAWQNDSHGILASQCSTIIGCAAYENTLSGFVSIFSGTAQDGEVLISECIASANGRYGFECRAGGMISGCVARRNFRHGFYVQYSTDVRECRAVQNGVDTTSAGFFCINSAGTRLSNNTSFSNPVGFQASTGSSTGGFLHGNIARANTTNWIINATNRAFVVNSTPNTEISGNNGGTPIGSTEPWVNFTF